jgi:hypothetical protein
VKAEIFYAVKSFLRFIGLVSGVLCVVSFLSDCTTDTKIGITTNQGPRIHDDASAAEPAPTLDR